MAALFGGHAADIGLARQPWLLPKTAFDGPMVVVIAGIEGTGHHGVCHALKPRCTTQSTQPCIHFDQALQDAVRPFFYPTVSSYWNATRDLKSRLGSLRLQLPPEHRVIFQCGSADTNASSFMASYPDRVVAASLIPADIQKYAGISTARPDVLTLARHAEAHGVDFRIVHLQREPVLSILSRAKHVRVSIDALIAVALDNAIALKAQLSGLDPAFVLELNHTHAKQRAPALAEFLRMPATFAEQFAQQWVSDDLERLEALRRRKPDLVEYVRTLWSTQVDHADISDASKYAGLYGVAPTRTI